MIKYFISGNNNQEDHHEHEYREQDKEAIRRTIDAAYHESTPEQQKELEQLKQDRKSTRLNSSHVSISYAVFCLKKKNTKTKRTRSYRKQSKTSVGRDATRSLS